MTCRYCGKEIQDGARFCPHCGASNSPDLGSGLPEGAVPYGASPAGPEAPVSGGKKKTGLLIGGAAAVVAVIALLVVAVSGLFTSPKKQLEKAMIKSIAAYETAEKKLGMPDVSQWQQDQTLGQRMSLTLKSVNSGLIGYDLSALSGLGLYLDTEYIGSARDLYIDLGARWGEDDLISFQIAGDDALLYLGSPQILGESFYGVDTETLGADLAEMTGDDSMEDLSFNIFDLVDILAPEGRTEEIRQSVKDANEALFDAIQVEKGGKEKISVNKNLVDTTIYRVTIPQEAMRDYANTLIGVMSAMDYVTLYQELFQAMGIPDEALEEMLSRMEGMDPYGQLSEAVGDAIDELGDVKLTVYVGGGYVSSVVYEGYLSNDSFLKLALYLGGGEEYVDDLRLEIKVDDQMVTIDSTGDHGCKKGSFTDETTIRGPFTAVTSKFEYVPNGSLSWEVTIPGAGSLEMSGTMTSGQDFIDLQMEDITLRVIGMEVCTLTLDYRVDRNPAATRIGDAEMIFEMSRMELMAAAMKIQANAQAWAEEMEALFAARLPEELLDMLM